MQTNSIPTHTPWNTPNYRVVLNLGSYNYLIGYGSNDRELIIVARRYTKKMAEEIVKALFDFEAP